jgi:hypothetical protein
VSGPVGRGERPVQVDRPRCVDTLQQSPVTCGGKRELVVGKSVWPMTAHDAHRHVLVDHEQRSGRIVGMALIEQEIGGEVRVKSSLEVVGEVPTGHPHEELSTGR